MSTTHYEAPAPPDPASSSASYERVNPSPRPPATRRDDPIYSARVVYRLTIWLIEHHGWMVPSGRQLNELCGATQLRHEDIVLGLAIMQQMSELFVSIDERQGVATIKLESDDIYCTCDEVASPNPCQLDNGRSGADSATSLDVARQIERTVPTAHRFLRHVVRQAGSSSGFDYVRLIFAIDAAQKPGPSAGWDHAEAGANFDWTVRSDGPEAADVANQALIHIRAQAFTSRAEWPSVPLDFYGRRALRCQGPVAWGVAALWQLTCRDDMKLSYDVKQRRFVVTVSPDGWKDSIVRSYRALQELEERSWTVSQVGFKKHGKVAILANRIKQEVHFASDLEQTLHQFVDGAYQPDGQKYIERQVQQLLAEHGQRIVWSSRLTSEVVEYVRTSAPVMWRLPPSNTIQLANGLLDVRTRQLLDPTADFLTPVRLPVAFDPTATCEFWDWFVQRVFPGDAQRLAWEIVAWTMTTDMSIDKFVLLVGEGGGGKSVFLRALAAFLGWQNVSSVMLHSLTDDRFQLAELYGKIANIAADIPSSPVEAIGVLKSVTSGELITAQRKHRPLFQFRPYCKCQ